MWPMTTKRSYDVICMGRVAVDLYADQTGVPLEDVKSFRKYLGGCAGNIAVGTARLGLRTIMFSCVGADAMGQFLKNELVKENVSIALVKESKQHLTGLVLLGIEPPDRFPLIFYRHECADMQLQASDITAKQLSVAEVIVMTGTGLSTEHMRNTSHAVAKMAKEVNTKVVLDLDYRPVLWKLTSEGDGETRYIPSTEVTAHYQAMLPYCDLIVGTEEEIMIAGGREAIHAICTAPVVMKRGADGAVVYFEDGTEQAVPTRPVEVLNVLGAGDAFMSGLLRGLLRGESWESSLTLANTCGGIVVTRHGCAPAMPFYEEIAACVNI